MKDGKATDDRYPRYDEGMSSALSRSGTEPEITEEEKTILTERLKTVEEDAKKAKDAYEVLAELRQRLLARITKRPWN